MSTVLVVCTGNICRSPIAEGFLRQLLEDRAIKDVEVESAGVSGLQGYPADPEAVRAAAEQGVDISEHRARKVRRRMVEQADLIVAMTAEQKESVTDLVPSAADRTFTLKELVFLLEHGRDEPPGDAKNWLAAATVRAASVRESEHALELLDEDVSDPLGLGPDAFQATVWEVGQLLGRFLDHAYASQRQPVGEAQGGDG